MRTLKFSLPLLLALSLFSCGPVVTFDQPQPAGVDPLSEFPEGLRGSYLSLADSPRSRSPRK